MMAAAMRSMVVLFMLISNTVSDDVYKLVNSSLQLDVKTQGYEFFVFTWSFNKDKNLVTHTKYSTEVPKYYKDRVEFDKETHRLTLKNLQKSDSGLYEAKTIHNKNEMIATYQLYVLDPVEYPVLNVSLQSNNTCNMTLTCESQKLSLTSHCYDDNCEEKTKVSEDSLPSLSLYVFKNVIICNYSNQVSWKNTTKEMIDIKQHCSGDEKPPNPLDWKFIALPIVTVLFLIIIIIAAFIICKRKKKQMDVHTVYEDVDLLKKEEKKTQSVEMSKSRETPATVYYTVGKAAEDFNTDENTVSSENPGNQEIQTNIYDTPEKDTPQTIYSTVNKPSKGT